MGWIASPPDARGNMSVVIFYAFEKRTRGCVCVFKKRKPDEKTFTHIIF